MILATATPDGKPSARVVLLKGYDERGFVFYTNYEGRKGEEIGRNPRAALVFYWGELERQVRIEGRVGRVPESESDAYYGSRPRGSRLGAWASEQSQAGREPREAGSPAARARSEYEGRRYPVRLSGAATASSPRWSSSGRAARTACTIGSSTAERATAGGRSNASSLEDAAREARRLGGPSGVLAAKLFRPRGYEY